MAKARDMLLVDQDIGEEDIQAAIDTLDLERDPQYIELM